MINTTFFHAVRGMVVSVLAGISALAVAPSIGYAAQFVLFDVTFTYTKADADNTTPNKSHYYVKGDLINPDRPRDWTSPVDYRNGTVHIRTEVIEKPVGGEPTTWTLCYIPNRGQGNGYGCTGTVLYREKGIYEQDVSMNSWWENKSIVWSEGIKQMDLVIKDGSGGSGHAHKRPDAERFFPTKMRITMIQVASGSTYNPSLVPNLRAGTGANRSGQTLEADGLRSGPRESGAGVPGSTDLFPLAGDFNFAVLQRALEAEHGLVDLIAGLFAGHYLELDLVPVDCAFENRKAAVVGV
jgi:hypothetical protein